MPQYLTPGVYKEESFLSPPVVFRTGVPVFLGYAAGMSPNTPHAVTLWSQFAQSFGAVRPDSYLADAVRGFFANGGTLCYVVRLDENLDGIKALEAGLETVSVLDAIDLVCAPDIMWPRERPASGIDTTVVQAMQNLVVNHCDRMGNRFVILDALPGADVASVIRQCQGLQGTNGALYFPWFVPASRNAAPVAEDAGVPPCGHIAGIYARTDGAVGVHKAPANETVEDILDVGINVTDADQAQLNPLGINCSRAFRGRGIRVWGARTLSHDPNWTYVNVRRLFLTAGRWVERTLVAVAFEPNDPRLWTRIARELTSYFMQLFAAGALQGRTAADAFFVKCDMETNPADVREAGKVVTEIGLAPSRPNEFVIVRIIHDTNGVSIIGPTQPG